MLLSLPYTHLRPHTDEHIQAVLRGKHPHKAVHIVYKLAGSVVYSIK